MIPPEQLFNQGLAHHRAGQWAQAESCYWRAVQMAPQYSDAWNNLGILAQNRQHTTLALDCYMKSIRHNPKFVAAWGNLGALFEGLGRYDEAIKCYEIGIRLDPRAEILSNLAGLYRERGRFQDCYACYRKALSLGGDNATHIHSAWVFTVDQDPSSTIEDRARIKREFRAGINAQT